MRLFVYGSLMEPELRRRLLGRQVSAEPGYLHGFERRHGRYFYLARKAGGVVAGQILSALSAQELETLDRYEEVPRLYTRRRVSVLRSDRRPCRAWVYLPAPRLLLKAPAAPR